MEALNVSLDFFDSVDQFFLEDLLTLFKGLHSLKTVFQPLFNLRFWRFLSGFVVLCTDLVFKRDDVGLASAMCRTPEQ